jgi:hypothetical protein
MRKLTQYTLIFLSTALAGCNNTLDFRNAEISNNKIYEAGKNSGFSGKITNIPLGKIPFGEIVPATNLIGKATGNKDINNLLYGASLSVGHDTVLCDASTNDGFLEGNAVCKEISSGNPIFKIAFKNNSIEGKATLFYLHKKEARLAELSYSNGKTNGELTVFGFSTGNPIYKAEFVNGIVNGKEQAFDENSGKLLFEGNIISGKYEGITTRYNLDGSVSEKLNWKSGEIQQTPTHSSASQSNADSEVCLDAWTAAFRKEQGAEAAVSMEQIDEWKTWCNQGKTPASH